MAAGDQRPSIVRRVQIRLATCRMAYATETGSRGATPFVSWVPDQNWTVADPMKVRGAATVTKLPVVSQ
jgi:hypothetical protein